MATNVVTKILKDLIKAKVVKISGYLRAARKSS
jgi:hypothetical protein